MAQSSSWDYEYLEALGVAVWLPQEQTFSHEVSESAVEPQPALKDESDKVDAVEIEARYVIPLLEVSSSQTQTLAKVHCFVAEHYTRDEVMLVVKKLQQAWKAWQEKPFPLSVWLEVDRNNASEQAQDMGDIQGQWYMDSDLPRWSLDSAENKKQWWEFLSQTFDD